MRSGGAFCRRPAWGSRSRTAGRPKRESTESVMRVDRGGLSVLRGEVAYHRNFRVTMLELPRMRLAPLSVSLLLGGSSFACGERGATVDAPAPQGEFSHDVDSLPSLPPGTIVAPLSLDLRGALAALERTVPRRFGNITQRLPLPGSKRKSYAFEIARDAFKVSFLGDTVVLGAVIHYKGRAWYDP